ncbi:Hypothetical protein HDN1F_21410 [gamma proteobacterium HdN1]|nr:Hypothetical protein HDN1F_21410 [gamma proteobacterium HdN1]
MAKMSTSEEVSPNLPTEALQLLARNYAEGCFNKEEYRNRRRVLLQSLSEEMAVPNIGSENKTRNTSGEAGGHALGFGIFTGLVAVSAFVIMMNCFGGLL